jgi:hypothetical protein
MSEAVPASVGDVGLSAMMGEYRAAGLVSGI